MTEVMIRAEGLGKLYRIGQAQPRRNWRDRLSNLRRLPAGLLAGRRERANDTIWALKDVSFEVRRGEAIGIIGRNGAGKSTLLKILSRITRPTVGQADIRGRVGSLLEVGTGFHPDLTGRENVFLNGAILGMGRAEIMRKFDEIIAFSEIDQFVDTPVKHYSSGMYVRLAFSVAAHLEPEILFLDEVLAVGDIAFQRKCLDLLESDARLRQVTTLMVSHNLGTIRELCSKALLMRQGQMLRFGPANEVCDEYLRLLNQTAVSRVKAQRLEKSEEATIFDCWCAVNNVRITQVSAPERLEIHAVVDIHAECRLSFETILNDADDHPIGFSQYGLAKHDPLHLGPGRYVLRLKFPVLPLATGRYSFTVSIGAPNLKYYDLIANAFTLDVYTAPDPLTHWTFLQSRRQGSLLFDCDLSIVAEDRVTAPESS